MKFRAQIPLTSANFNAAISDIETPRVNSLVLYYDVTSGRHHHGGHWVEIKDPQVIGRIYDKDKKPIDITDFEIHGIDQLNGKSVKVVYWSIDIKNKKIVIC